MVPLTATRLATARLATARRAMAADYWALQDVFHLGTGFTCTIILMGIASSITQQVQAGGRRIIHEFSQGDVLCIDIANIQTIVSRSIEGIFIFGVLVDFIKVRHCDSLPLTDTPHQLAPSCA